MSMISFQSGLFKQLLLAKFSSVRGLLKDKVINIYIWAGCCILITGYVMQSFGLAGDFGPFQLGGVLASIGIFDLYTNVINMVADIEGDKAISYYLALPGSAFTVLCSYVCFYATIAIGISFTLLPFGKLLLWNKFNFLSVAWPKLLFFIVLINLVCAVSTLLLAALIPSMEKVEILWMRYIFPLWLLGGFQSSWLSVNFVSPWLSYVTLLNPVIYMTEGVRGALLGQRDYISFWICCVFLIVLFFVIGALAFKALKKRLDFV